MLPSLNLHFALLRIDWPLLLSGTALGLTLVGGLAMGMQLRRTRRRVLGTLERVFEQLDLMRLDAQPQDETVLAPVRTQAAARTAVPPAMRRPLAPAELVDYQSAARLAAHGAPLAEIAERCGVVSGEARVLLALQQRMQGARRGSPS